MEEREGTSGRGGRDVRVHDQELTKAVRRAQEGDEEAFVSAYRLVNPLLIGYLRGIVGNEAEDVASTAWLEIARDLRRFRGDGAGFRAWTVVIARNRALDLLRHQKARPQPSPTGLDDLLHPPSLDRTDDRALENISTQQVLSHLAALPRGQAEAVLLTTIVGLDGPTVARILGKRPGAIRTALSRGLSALRQRLAAPEAISARTSPDTQEAPDRRAAARISSPVSWRH
ncbi:RNA polymerase sigma factor [Streptomyces sp. NPDC004788]